VLVRVFHCMPHYKLRDVIYTQFDIVLESWAFTGKE
jgi:hypothetical protein